MTVAHLDVAGPGPTLADLDRLPPTLTTPQLAALLGVHPESVYDGVRRGDFPLEPIRVGRRILWATAAVLRLLRVEEPCRSR